MAWGEAAKLHEEIERLKVEVESARQDEGLLKGRVQELEGLLRERDKLFIIMVDLANRLGDTLPRDQIIGLMLRLVKQLFDGAEEISIFLRDPETNQLEFKSCIGLPEDQCKGLRIPLGEGYIGHVAQKRVVMSAVDFESESNIIKNKLQRSQYNQLASEMVAPIVHGTELIGVLNIGKFPQRVKEAKGFLLILSNLVAIALNNVRLFEELQSMDTLTGLYSRRVMMELLEGEINRGQRFKHELSVVIFNLDKFRDYNEVYGQAAGDEVLRTVGGILKSAIRKIDIVARYGDDVFAAALVETGKDSGMLLAEKVRKVVGEHPFPHGTLTFSAGLATCPTDACEPKALVEAALGASAQAKKQGGDRVVAVRAGQ
jgi:diguanylate cyclase (GGDEF)-like protein